jgi:hypothetical protein
VRWRSVECPLRIVVAMVGVGCREFAQRQQQLVVLFAGGGEYGRWCALSALAVQVGAGPFEAVHDAALGGQVGQDARGGVVGEVPGGELFVACEAGMCRGYQAPVAQREQARPPGPRRQR